MLTFDDTNIAFGSKSNTDLHRAYSLFKTISSPGLVKISKEAIRIARVLHLPISWAVKPTIYKQFVGGETLSDCAPLVRTLEKFNVKAILDYSVEGISTEEYIRHTIDEILKTIDLAAMDPNIPFAVFKPTALCSEAVLEKASTDSLETVADKLEARNFHDRMEVLCQHAFDKDVRIMIDAEDSWYQPYIDDVVSEMMEKFNKKTAIVYNTLQMYHIDRLDYLNVLYEKALHENFYLGIKFVRGAYMEKERVRANQKGYPSPIQPDKSATDQSFNEGLSFAVSHIDRIHVFNGTHNENSTRLLISLMEEFEIEKDDERCFFSQLYGMSDNISFILAKQGFNVAKYIPYGPVGSVLPYLIRRAEENTAIAGQSGRELSLIVQELKRRKNLKV
jgi:proline dehydrogenase